MKICYLISNHGLGGKGGGGHFYSMRTLAQVVVKRCDCMIINIGPEVSPVIEAAKVPSYDVYFTGFNMIRALRNIIRAIGQEKPDVLHAFDSDSYFFGRCAALRYKIPLLLTKAGGPNPRLYFPYADQLFLFSAENKHYFENRRKYRNTCLHLIPNRVLEIKPDLSRIEKMRNRLNDNEKVFLRIGRFSKDYKRVMIQCKDLIDKLNRDGYQCQLVVIGAIQNRDVYEEIARFENNHIKIFCSDEYTVNANELIDVADFVIGTGRGFMEAASMGKVLLTPLKNQQYPVLVTEENFGNLFATNFSPRGYLANYSEESNYLLIGEALADESMLERRKLQSRFWFESYFSIKFVIDTYCEIYKSSTINREKHPIDFVLHMAMCLRSFIKS